MTGRGRDIFKRPSPVTDEAVRRRVEVEDRARGVVPLARRQQPRPAPPTAEVEAELAQRLTAAAVQRTRSQRAYDRDLRVLWDLVLECSRAGMSAVQIARVAGISHQRVVQIRQESPEAKARAAVFAEGEAVEVG